MKNYNFKLYQVKTAETDYIFMPYSYAERHGFCLEDYDCACTGTYPAEDHNDLLESLFEVFNMGRNPEGVRSMSVSDIVEVEDTKYYCDSHGWATI